MYNWSVRPCYDCWWYSGNHRWTRTLPIGPPRSTSRKMVLFVPRPWYRCCCRHIWQATLWHALLSWPCKMSAPFLLSTTWWAHNPQFHRIETWLSCTPSSQGCSSRAASYVIHGPPSQVIYFGSRRNTQSHCSGPLSHVVSDIEQWPIRLKLLMVPSYFTLDIFLSSIRELLPTPFPELCTR